MASEVDRPFSSQMCLDSWDMVNCVVLPRFFSDYNPLLFKFCDKRTVSLKPFRFQPMWIKDVSFLSIVFLAWKT